MTKQSNLPSPQQSIQWTCGQCNTPFEVEKVDDIIGDRPDHSTAEEGKDGVQYCSKECRAKAMFEAAAPIVRNGLRELARAIHIINDLSVPLQTCDHLEDWGMGTLSVERGRYLMVSKFLDAAYDLQRELGGEHDFPEWAK